MPTPSARLSRLFGLSTPSRFPASRFPPEARRFFVFPGRVGDVRRSFFLFVPGMRLHPGRWGTVAAQGRVATFFCRRAVGA